MDAVSTLQRQWRHLRSQISVRSGFQKNSMTKELRQRRWHFWGRLQGLLYNIWPLKKSIIYIQIIFPRGKGGRCVRLTTLPSSCAVVTKSGSLNFLEPSGPVQACNGTALPVYIFNLNKRIADHRCTWKHHRWGNDTRISMSMNEYQPAEETFIEQEKCGKTNRMKTEQACCCYFRGLDQCLCPYQSECLAR